MSYQIIFENAINFYREGELDKAESLARELLQSMPEEPQIKKMLGLIAYEKEFYEQSAEIFYDILSTDKNNPEILLNLAQTLEAWGKHSEALDYYEKIIEINPSEIACYYGKGVCLQSLNELSQAKKAYEKALSIDENCYQALLGLASLETEDVKKALNILKKALEVSPKNPFVLYQTAQIHKQEKDYESAFIAIEAAVSEYPHPKMKELLGVLYDLKGEEEKAFETYNQILNEHNNYIPATILISEIYVRRGDLKKAKEVLKNALEWDKNNIDVLINLGIIAHKQGLLLEAIENYRKVIEINPNIPEVLLNFAFILHEQGDLDEALGMYFNVLSMKKDIPNLDKGLFEAISDYIEIDKVNAKKLADLWLKEQPENAFAQKIHKTLTI